MELLFNETEVHEVVKVIEQEEFLFLDSASVVHRTVIADRLAGDMDFAFIARIAFIDDQDVAILEVFLVAFSYGDRCEAEIHASPS